MVEERTCVNPLRPLLLRSSPPLTVLPLREQWLNRDVLNKHPALIYHYFLSTDNKEIFTYTNLIFFTFPFSSKDNFSNCILNVRL